MTAPRSGLPSVLSRALHLGGVDRAVAYAALARGLQVVGAPVTLLLIERLLSREEQGYYFTFASLLALSLMLELGLSQVLLVAASHERARLEWTPDGLLRGAPQAQGRLGTLLRMALAWYAVVAVLLVAALLPAGAAFFERVGQPDAAVVWRTPWALAVVATAGTCLVSPIWALLEGCGLVAEVERARLAQQVAGTLALWAGLAGGARLYAPALNLGAALAVGLLWLAVRRRAALRDLARSRSAPGDFAWRREVWPMQWRMALSFAAGWFVYQVFNPLVFAYEGAAAAGRMGMTLSLSQALLAVGSAWSNTKAAVYGRLVARRERAALDALFRRTLRQSVAIVAAGAAAVVAAIALLRQLGIPLAERLLDPWPAAALMGVAVANQVVFAQAIYLRAHRREPLLGVTMAHGAAVALTSWYLASRHGSAAVAAGYLALTLVVFLGGGTAVFVARRREWAREGGVP